MNTMRTRIWTLATLLVLAALAPAAAQAPEAKAPEAKAPDTPAGAALGAWLEAVASGAEAGGAHFDATFTDSFKAQVPRTTYLQMFEQVKATLDGARLLRIDARDDHALAAYFKGSLGDFVVTVEVESAAPHKVAGLMIQPGKPPNVSNQLKPPKDLAALLRVVRMETGLPGIAAAHVKGGAIVEQAAAGVRESGTEKAVTEDDLFHVGSVTKSLTATLIARLIEKGTLSWDTTLAQALPGMKMRKAYRDVTLEQLLRHRGGLVPDKNFDDERMKELVGLPGSPTAQRAAYLKQVLRQEPVAPPGTEQHYSNAGYSLVGHIAERATGTSWETLLAAEVFKPLKLDRAGFGWPATDERPNQPRGHLPAEGGLRVQALDEYSLGSFLAPAGDVHMSIADLARFASEHLAGLQGRDGILKASTVERLHTPAEGADYAGGWVVARTEGGETLHWHNGSAGTFYALVALFPDSDEAVVVTTNAAVGADRAAMKVVTGARK